MNRTLQILIAATCIVVLICGAVWLSSQNELRKETAHDRAADEMVDRIVTGSWVAAQKAAADAKVIACSDALEAYDSRNETFAFVERVKASGQVLTGDAMQAEVAACRDLIQSSKPAEQPE